MMHFIVCKCGVLAAFSLFFNLELSFKFYLVTQEDSTVWSSLTADDVDAPEQHANVDRTPGGLRTRLGDRPPKASDDIVAWSRPATSSGNTPLYNYGGGPSMLVVRFF